MGLSQALELEFFFVPCILFICLGRSVFPLATGKHLTQDQPFVYTLQCLTGKLDINNNPNKICLLYFCAVLKIAIALYIVILGTDVARAI